MRAKGAYLEISASSNTYATANQFRCVPRSHLSLHADANPYTRYGPRPGAANLPGASLSLSVNPNPNALKDT
jgi:hypothetical protein